MRRLYPLLYRISLGIRRFSNWWLNRRFFYWEWRGCKNRRCWLCGSSMRLHPSFHSSFHSCSREWWFHLVVCRFHIVSRLSHWFLAWSQNYVMDSGIVSKFNSAFSLGSMCWCVTGSSPLTFGLFFVRVFQWFLISLPVRPGKWEAILARLQKESNR